MFYSIKIFFKDGSKALRGFSENKDELKRFAHDYHDAWQKEFGQTIECMQLVSFEPADGTFEEYV